MTTTLCQLSNRKRELEERLKIEQTIGLDVRETLAAISELGEKIKALFMLSIQNNGTTKA